MRFNLSDQALEAKVLRLPGVQRRIDEIADDVQREAHDLTRLNAHDTGKLADNIRVIPDGVARRIRMSAGAGQPRRLPVWINKGTGIYGPSGRPIRPKKQGGVLVFTVKDGGTETTVFAREVKGRPPTPVMRDAGVAVAARLRLRWRPSNT